MALKVKAVERLLKFSNKPDDPGVYRFVMKPDMYSTLTQAKVIKDAADCIYRNSHRHSSRSDIVHGNVA